MESKVTYSKFKKIIKSINVVISEEQYVKFTPTSRTVNVNGEDVIEEFVEVQIADEQTSYDETFEASRTEITELIQVLQELRSQIK